MPSEGWEDKGYSKGPRVMQAEEVMAVCLPPLQCPSLPRDTALTPSFSVYLPGLEAASHLPLSVVLNLAVVLALCVLCSLGEPFNLSKQVCCERRKTPLSLDCCDNQVQRKHLLDRCVFGHPLLPFFGTLFSFLFILRHNHNTDFRGQSLIHGGLSELRKKG